MISIASLLSKVYSVAGMAIKNKENKISKTKLTIVSVLAFPLIVTVWKVMIATGVCATVGFTSGKVVKRLKDRRVSC